MLKLGRIIPLTNWIVGQAFLKMAENENLVQKNFKMPEPQPGSRDLGSMTPVGHPTGSRNPWGYKPPKQTPTTPSFAHDDFQSNAKYPANYTRPNDISISGELGLPQQKTIKGINMLKGETPNPRSPYAQPKGFPEQFPPATSMEHPLNNNLQRYALAGQIQGNLANPAASVARQAKMQEINPLLANRVKPGQLANELNSTLDSSLTRGDVKGMYTKKPNLVPGSTVSGGIESGPRYVDINEIPFSKGLSPKGVGDYEATRRSLSNALEAQGHDPIKAMYSSGGSGYKSTEIPGLGRVKSTPVTDFLANSRLTAPVRAAGRGVESAVSAADNFVSNTVPKTLGNLGRSAYEKVTGAPFPMESLNGSPVPQLPAAASSGQLAQMQNTIPSAAMTSGQAIRGTATTLPKSNFEPGSTLTGRPSILPAAGEELSTLGRVGRGIGGLARGALTGAIPGAIAGAAAGWQYPEPGQSRLMSAGRKAVQGGWETGIKDPVVDMYNLGRAGVSAATHPVDTVHGMVAAGNPRSDSLSAGQYRAPVLRNPGPINPKFFNQ
jgi:hypothetical protein